ncbi:kelch-like protein 30 isoform X2 [Poeciliopsis prolifica]|uniref:kelch-like protein 30 isoform X2 n=1 Tax=Poeciliopsis prolifica TaxID=188132 RepID=UPI002413CA64|nr:kelch-like protein 30 isoform X2 [Poeciliopsis prolifica]
MVRNVDDLDFCLSSHPQSILEGLRLLCSHPKLVDVTLSAGGRDFPCHRGVLALCSMYFRSMFSGDFVESIAARVELQDVDPDILSYLLDFAYTGKLTINQSNVEGLICTSSQLQFQTVRAVCSRYLQNQIDETNCLGILEFGEIHGCPEIVAKARAFLLETFEAVQQGEEFLFLGKDQLTACLSDEELKIRSECTRVEAILKWVGHQKESRLCHLPELFSLSHLSLLSLSYLTDTLLKDSLVQASPRCREAIQEVCREKQDLAQEYSERLNYQSPQPNLQEVLFVMGGRSLDDEDDNDSDEDDNRDPRLQRLPSKNCAFYNTKTSTTSAQVEVERYDPYSNSWALTCPALKYVTNFTATACFGKLFVIGSCAVKYNALTMQCYNPVIDAWISIGSPFIPKYLSSPRSVCMDGIIYLLADNTKKVYSYDPEANMWQKVQLLHMLHENGGLVSLDGQLYVTGGHWKGMEGDYGVEVEVYNRASNTWDVECFLPRLWFYSGVSTIFLDPSQWPELPPIDLT